MGVEMQNAVLSDRVLQLNMTNEGGIDGTFRLLKNITGLWLVQQCKRAFEARGRNLDYAELARLAEESPGPARSSTRMIRVRQSARHAGRNPVALPGKRPARAGKRRRAGAVRVGESGRQVCPVLEGLER